MPGAEAMARRRVLPQGRGHGPRKAERGRVPHQLRQGALPALNFTHHRLFPFKILY